MSNTATLNQSNLIDHRSFFTSHASQKKIGEHKLRFVGVIDKNIEQLRILNNTVYPIKYKEKVYEQVLKRGPEFSSFAIFNDIAVGSYSCRIEKHNGQDSVYVMLLGVLPRYRKLGIGKQLMDQVFEVAKKHHVTKCHLHVQDTNEAAIKFYESLGFKTVEKLIDFYNNDGLDESQSKNCFLMEINLA